MVPIIDNRLADNLTPNIKQVIQMMFDGYEKVIILSEFSDGYTPSRVFLIRTIKSDGPQLRSVIKVGPVGEIKKEWQAYRDIIEQRLTRIAHVQQAPTFLSNNHFGGLWYSLAADGVFDFMDFAAFAEREEQTKVLNVLNRLLVALDALWGPQKFVETEMHFRQVYDSFLPANLMLEELASIDVDIDRSLYPSTIKNQAWAVGDVLQLDGFVPTKIDRENNHMMLNTNSSTPYRLTLASVSNIAQYNIDQPLPKPIFCRVVNTRRQFLEEKVAGVLGDDSFVTQAHFEQDGNLLLPNPLMAIDQLQDRSFDNYQSSVHGDLHLKNILVEEKDNEVYIIDFGSSRKDYIMFDLLDLESSIMRTLFSKEFKFDKTFPTSIFNFYKRLHCHIVEGKDNVAIPANLPFDMLVQLRQAARNYLFNQQDWRTYYDALCLHFISSLKFSSLSDAEKQVMFWGAAAILKINRDAPRCSDFDVRQSQAAELDSTTVSQEPIGQHNRDQSSDIQLLNSWKFYTGAGVASVALSKNGKQFLAGTLGKDVFFLDQNGELLWQKSVGNQAWRAGLGLDAKTAVIGTGSTRFWDMKGRGLFWFEQDGRLRHQVDLAASAWGLAVSADGSTVAVGTSEKQLIVFDNQGHKLWQHDVAGLGWYAWVWSAALSADGGVIAAGAADKRIRIWRRSGVLLGEYATRADVFATAVSADGRTIAAGDSSGHVYCLDRQGQLLWEESLADKVWAVALSTDGQSLLVGAGEKEAHIRIYNQAGQFLWKRHVGGSVINVGFSAQGNRVVAGTRDGGIFIFDREQVLHQARAEEKVRDVAISPNGEWVVAGSEDGYVYGFQLPSSIK
ncbi:MAG: PQQ-binding-like beta-propeller repeat protein [Chloroflexota bacterium]